MMLRICDRCKREIKETDGWKRKINIVEYGGAGIANYVYEKEICKDCAIDIMNILDFEFNQFKYESKVTLNTNMEAKDE